MRLRVSRVVVAPVIFAVCLALTSATFAQSNILRWNLQEGQVFKIETTIKQQQKIPSFGMEMEITQGVFTEWVVKSVNDDKYTIGQKIKRMTMNMDSPMMQMEIDTDDKEAGGELAQVGEMLGALIDEEIEFEMDSLGVVGDVKVPESLVERLSGGAMMGMGGLGPEMFEQFAKQSTLVFPKESVSETSEWKYSSTVKTMGTMKFDTTYKYLGEDKVDGVALQKIGVTADITMEDGEIPGVGGSIDIESSESTGNVWFDNSKGYLVKSEVNQKMDMVMDVMGMEMAVASTTKTNVKMTQVK
ncbi:MAG TPA: DUF6263 family protein [Pirellulaceae bacterium]|nr:DUF6263 family protein [Pirellulaceae bacterium]HMO91230.1 DUF6263 family protein [Pirellulaceae bacterium]HMP68586.1 DUF6263 family protein [Pirellulaceae bacterium]